MLKELIGYCNSVKETQTEMKVALSEIKKNLQWTNSGESNQLFGIQGNRQTSKQTKNKPIRTTRRKKNLKTKTKQG